MSKFSDPLPPDATLREWLSAPDHAELPHWKKTPVKVQGDIVVADASEQGYETLLFGFELQEQAARLGVPNNRQHLQSWERKALYESMRGPTVQNHPRRR